MSLALYIVINADEPGFDTFIEGKAIANAADELNTLCEEAGIAILDAYVGQPIDELDALDEDAPDLDENGAAASSAQWFDASEGVAWVQALIELVEDDPDALEDADGLLQELDDVLHVLEQAQAARLHWHFAWDF